MGNYLVNSRYKVYFRYECNYAYVHTVFRYSTDFGKNETEVLKHAANYLEPAQSEQLLELLASTQLKVFYQPYDWSINI